MYFKVLLLLRMVFQTLNDQGLSISLKRVSELLCSVK